MTIPHFLAHKGRTGWLIPHFLDQPHLHRHLNGPGLRFSSTAEGSSPPVRLSGVTEGAQLDPKTDFRQLYDQEFLSVYRSIRGVVLDSAAAEDLTQETFVRAYRARYRYTPTAPPGAWLRRIGINLAISHLRRQKLARFLPARLYVAPDRRDYDRAEARDVVEKAMAQLSPKLRAAVVLHYYEGLTREEIADVLGVPAGTVASRIAKAVAIMRKAMASDQQRETERSTSEGALRGR